MVKSEEEIKDSMMLRAWDTFTDKQKEYLIKEAENKMINR